MWTLGFSAAEQEAEVAALSAPAPPPPCDDPPLPSAAAVQKAEEAVDEAAGRMFDPQHLCIGHSRPRAHFILSVG